MDEWNLKIEKLIEDVNNHLEPQKIEKVTRYAPEGYILFKALGKKLLAFYGFGGNLVILQDNFNYFDGKPKIKY
jgi:hypothetical protein